MQTHTAKQLRTYSVKAEVEKIYYDILSAAKNGEHSCMFLLPKEKEVFILLELTRLFPDTKFTEVNSIYRHATMLSASWSVLS